MDDEWLMFPLIAKSQMQFYHSQNSFLTSWTPLYLDSMTNMHLIDDGSIILRIQFKVEHLQPLAILFEPPND